MKPTNVRYNKHINPNSVTVVMRFDLDEIRCYSSQTGSYECATNSIIRINGMFPICEVNTEVKIFDNNEYTKLCHQYGSDFISKIIDIFNFIYKENND